MSITKILTDKLSAAFAECGYSAELGTVVTSDRPDLCQFQCNGAFAGAKLYHKAPRMIAADAAAKLEGDADLEKVEVVGAGFINITVSDEFLLGYVKQALADENLGIPQAEKPETVVLDYGGPNVAKPLHIGHLRSAVIGEALKRLVRATGRKTISDVHLGDWGLQMGLVMAELQERHPEWACFAEDFDAENFAGVDLDAESLNVIYPFASAKSKENDDFKQKARAVTAKLQKGDPGYTALWREIIRISVADMKKNYENLNVDFDYWYGESDAEKYVPELLDVLNEKGLLHESQGAMVVDVAEESDKITIPPVIIKKSDNSNIYATTDLATLIQREHDFKPDQIWYIVDARQGLHFTQVFRCAKKAGLVPEEVTLAHIGYGTMNGADGKPYKTREGGVMRLADFYNTVYEAALERVSASNFSKDADREDIARKITVATIKFGDLVNYCMKDYVFDMDKFMAPDGKTGSFLLYTIARINSILKKAEGAGEQFDSSAVYTDSERDLLLKISLSGEAFALAYREKAPSVICENAYQLASAFSKFYHDNHILTEEDADKKRAWLNICAAVRTVLEKHLDVLGIEPVEMM
ncbi:arginine--tRNA ligase [Ruminococcus sp. 210702-SL.1.03]|uniref:arginine--tRNA ligase n=1 Tax=Ruminococcus sp. 210702-SL.1.03 TaxID=2883233 RepID=UPI001D08B512|nr:arginine--tRNA ligase [Ruminococcus sp. 210702-SL.1.03]MCB6615101.1 arginine--tRNA ligase [Ruminococcus sp. 210702-SL.1.03]